MMTAQTRTTLKAWQNAGFKPSVGDMIDLIDSIVNLTDDAASDTEAIAKAAEAKFLTPKNLAALGSTSTLAGLVELATDAEAQAKSATDKALVPSNLAALGASDTFAGLIELATDAEAVTGAATDKAVTPANLAAAVTTHVSAASASVAGKVELATNAEARAETDTARSVTPANLRQGAPALGAGSLEAMFPQHYQIAPAANSATGVHAAIPLTGAEQDITTAITNPDVPRTVTIKGNAAGMAGNVVVTGTDIEGGAITDTIALNGVTEVEGIKAFKTVTNIHVPAQTHDPDAAQQETAVIVGTITTTGAAEVTVTAAGSPALAAGKAVSVNVSQGVKQAETATIVGTVTTSGDATVTVTAAGMNGGVAVPVTVAVLQGQNQVETATAAGTITTTGLGGATVTAAGYNGGVATKTNFAVSQGVKQQETGTIVGTITTDGNATVTVTAAGMNGGTPVPVSVAVQSGVAQVETATVVAAGDITGAGFMKCVLTAVGMTGTPITTKEYVLVGDTAADCAAAMRARLGLDSRITDFFTISGAGADIVLTAKTKAANDATMNLTVENDTCTGITDDTTSADTAAGVAPDDATAVAGKARTALGLNGDVNGFFTIGGSGADILLTAKAEAADDATMNIASDNDTCAGLTAQATSANTTAGVAPDDADAIAASCRSALNGVSGITTLFTVGGSGADITLTRIARVADDATLNIALADDTCVGITAAPNSVDTTAGVLQDDASGVAGKARTALGLDATVSAFFDIAGSGANIILTAKAEAADDATMNIASDNDTCAGLTAAPTSVDTTAGVAPDDASAVADKVRTALGLDGDVIAFFTVSGAGANVILTANTMAPNDATMNIAYDNDTCAGLTPDATSTDTTAGAYDSVSVGRAKKFGLPHIVYNAAMLLIKMFNGSTDAGSLAVDADEIEKNLYSLNGTPDGAQVIDLVYLV